MSDSAKKSWRDVVDAAKNMTSDLATDERTKSLLDKAKGGASAAARGLDVTKRRITQEEAWAEVTEILNELVDVVLVQQQILDGLVERVEAVSEEPKEQA